MTNALTQSKLAASRWATLFQRALVDCVDVEEALLVADLAYESLPDSVQLSTEDKLGHLHGDNDGRFVKKGDEGEAPAKYKQGSGKGTLYKVDKNSGESPSEVQDKAQIDREEYLSRLYPNRIHRERFPTEDEVTHQEISVANMMYDIIRGANGKEKDVSPVFVEDKNPELDDHLSSWTEIWSGKREKFAEVGYRPNFKDKGKGVIVSGNRDVFIPVDTPDDETSFLIHRALGMSSPKHIRDKFKEKYSRAKDQNLSIDAYFAHDIENRKAQGILNRAIAASKKMTASARRDLAKALSVNNREDLAKALQTFIDRYRLQLADILTTSQLASLLAGSQEVARSIPNVPMFPSALPPATLEPQKAVELIERLQQMPVAEREQAIYELPPDQQMFARQGLLAMQQGSSEPHGSFIPEPPPEVVPEKVHYPIIDEAAKSLAEKNVMSKHQFEGLDGALRQRAFTIASVESDETIAKIRDTITESIQNGVDLATFREAVLSAVDAGTFMSDAHLETVYRTAVQTAFSDGQMMVLQHPFVRSGFPYATYDAIRDSRVRHNHLAMETLGIQGTNVFRLSDPVFQLFRPPSAWNCFLPDTVVQGRFNVGLKSWYSGEVVEIVTSQGNRLTVTANHPILTPDGFVAANLFRKGDYVLSYGSRIEGLSASGSFSSAARNLKSRCNKNSPSTIKEVFEAISDFGSIGSFPLTAHDLHGDGKFVDGNVQVVGSDRILLNDRNLETSYRSSNFAFPEMNVEFAGKTRLGFLDFRGKATLESYSSIGSFFYKNFPFGDVSHHLCGFQFLDIGEAANLNASLYESLPDGRITTSEFVGQLQKSFSSQVSRNDRRNIDENPVLMGGDFLNGGEASERNIHLNESSSHNTFADIALSCNLLKRNAGKVFLDKIVSVRKRDFSHWVYDLQSPYGFMVANSIVTSNCRCSWTPITIRQAASHGIDEAKTWLETGVDPSPPAFVPMPSFRPPPGFQRSVSLAVEPSPQPPPAPSPVEPSPTPEELKLHYRSRLDAIIGGDK